MIVGQKVVCIDDKFPAVVRELYTALPVEGAVYVIRAVKFGVNWQAEPGEVCLYLIGLNNPTSSTPPHPERGFNSERFRPLDEHHKDEHMVFVEAHGKSFSATT
jgi:hypothetical protein